MKLRRYVVQLAVVSRKACQCGRMQTCNWNFLRYKIKTNWRASCLQAKAISSLAIHLTPLACGFIIVNHVVVMQQRLFENEQHTKQDIIIWEEQHLSASQAYTLPYDECEAIFAFLVPFMIFHSQHEFSWHNGKLIGITKVKPALRPIHNLDFMNPVHTLSNAHCRIFFFFIVFPISKTCCYL